MKGNQSFVFDRCLWPKNFGDNRMTLFGGMRDGGYPILNLDKSLVRYFVSIGVSSDWGFEISLLQQLKLHGKSFDGQTKPKLLIRHLLGALFRADFLLVFLLIRRVLQFALVKTGQISRWELVTKNIGFDSVCGGWISLDSVFKQCGYPADILLKVDIEGGEYRILPDIVKHADRIHVLLIEFHDADVHSQIIERFSDVLRVSGLTPYFLRPNNCAPSRGDGKCCVFEIGFSRSPSSGLRADYSLPVDMLNSADGYKVSLSSSPHST